VNRYAPLLRHGGFRAIWAAAVVSGLGDRIAGIALYLLIYDLTGSALDLGLLAATQIVPAILLGPVTGLVCDRTGRKGIMVTADGISALVVAAIPLATSAGQVYALAALLGCGRQFSGPARLALLPDVVGPERLGAANSLLMLTRNLVLLIGPAVGGALVAWRGTDPAFWFDAATFVASAVILALWRFDEPVRGATPLAAAAGASAAGAAAPSPAASAAVAGAPAAAATAGGGDGPTAPGPAAAATAAGASDGPGAPGVPGIPGRHGAGDAGAVEPDGAPEAAGAPGPGSPSPPPPPATLADRVRRLWREAADGLLGVWSHPGLRLAFGFFAVLTFVTAMQQPLVVVFVKEVLQGSDTQLGLIISAAGLGGILGAVAGAAAVSRGHPLRTIALLTVLDGALLLLFAATRSFWLALVLFTCFGALATLAQIALATFLQETAPDDRRGRTFGWLGTVIGPLSLAAVFLGPLAASVAGVVAVLAACGGAELLVGAAGWRLRPRPSPPPA
jgi:MFS family permease